MIKTNTDSDAYIGFHFYKVSAEMQMLLICCFSWDQRNCEYPIPRGHADPPYDNDLVERIVSPLFPFSLSISKVNIIKQFKVISI